MPPVPVFLKDERRGDNATRGTWLSLEEATERTPGNEEWWRQDLYGKTVSVKQYDATGPRDKPIWMFEDGDMYLGQWKKCSDRHQYPVEQGFGVTYLNRKHSTPAGRVYVGQVFVAVTAFSIQCYLFPVVCYLLFCPPCCCFLIFCCCLFLDILTRDYAMDKESPCGCRIPMCGDKISCLPPQSENTADNMEARKKSAARICTLAPGRVT